MSDALVIPAPVRAELVLWSLAAYPREACGLLLGRERRVERARLARNVAGDPRRFELDPAEHLRVEREAENAGLTVLGSWHSHPDAPAVPSDADRAAAFAPWSTVILSVDGEALVDLRSFAPRGDTLVEEAVL